MTSCTVVINIIDFNVLSIKEKQELDRKFWRHQNKHKHELDNNRIRYYLKVMHVYENSGKTKIHALPHTGKTKIYPLPHMGTINQIGKNRFDMKNIAQNNVWNKEQTDAVLIMSGQGKGFGKSASVTIHTLEGVIQFGLTSKGVLQLRKVPKNISLKLQSPCPVVIPTDIKKLSCASLSIQALSFKNDRQLEADHIWITTLADVENNQDLAAKISMDIEGGGLINRAVLGTKNCPLNINLKCQLNNHGLLLGSKLNLQAEILDVGLIKTEGSIVTKSRCLKVFARVIGQQWKATSDTFEYSKEVFHLKKNFDLTLSDGSDFHQPLTNLGGFSFVLQAGATKGFNFWDDIKAGYIDPKIDLEEQTQNNLNVSETTKVLKHCFPIATQEILPIIFCYFSTLENPEFFNQIYPHHFGYGPAYPIEIKIIAPEQMVTFSPEQTLSAPHGIHLHTGPMLFLDTRFITDKGKVKLHAEGPIIAGLINNPSSPKVVETIGAFELMANHFIQWNGTEVYADSVSPNQEKAPKVSLSGNRGLTMSKVGVLELNKVSSDVALNIVTPHSVWVTNPNFDADQPTNDPKSKRANCPAAVDNKIRFEVNVVSQNIQKTPSKVQNYPCASLTVDAQSFISKHALKLDQLRLTTQDRVDLYRTEVENDILTSSRILNIFDVVKAKQWKAGTYVFQYKDKEDVFQIAKSFDLTLFQAMDFTVPLNNSGSMSITFLDPGSDPSSVRKFQKKGKPLKVSELKKNLQNKLQGAEVVAAKKESDESLLSRQHNNSKNTVPALKALKAVKALKPIHILTEISAGFSKNPIAAANLHFNAGDHPVYIGSEAGPYIKIRASGHTQFAGKKFDLINGKIVGFKGAGVSSPGNIKIGRLHQYTTMPSGILSGAEVVLDTHKKVLLEASYIFGETGVGFRAGKKVDNISGHIISGGDACFDTPHFHHRLLSEVITLSGRENYPCANIFESYKRYISKVIAKSEPAYLMVGKVFTTNAEIENLGSFIHVDRFQGKRNNSASIKHFIAYTTWVHEMFCGHESYGRCQWYFVHKITTDKMYQAVFNSNTKLKLNSKLLNCTGIISAPELSLTHFDEAMIGATKVEVELPAPKKFKAIVKLPAIQSPRYEYVAGAYYSALPKLCANVRPPAVIFNSDGSLSLMNTKMSAFMPEDMEEETLVKTLLHEFGKGSLDKDTTDPAEILYKLLNNAWKFVKTERTSTGLDHQGNPNWYSKLNIPLLVYKEINVDGQFKCWPHLIIPLSWDNPKLRDGVFGLFSSGDINIRGANPQTSKLTITAHIDAGGMVRFNNMKSIKFQKLLHVEKQVVEDTFITESWGGLRRKTQRNVKEVRIVTPQPGNDVSGEGVYISNVGDIHFDAAEINAGDKGITAKNVGSIVATAVDATKVVSKLSSAESIANYAEHSQNITEHQLIPSRFKTTGAIQLQTQGKQAYHSAEMLAKKNIELNSDNDLLLGAATASEERPTMMQSKTFTIAVTTGNATHGIPVTMVSMEGDILCKSEGTMVSVGTKMFAKEVKQTADKQLIVEPLRLEENSQTNSRGFRGLKYFTQTRDERHESGILAALVAQRSIRLSSKTSNLLLIAPRLFAGDLIQFSAPNGTFTIIPASFHHDVSIQEFSVGVSFFGSKVVEAAMQRNFREALEALRSEFPLLDSIEKDLKSKDTADKIGNGMKTLYHAYKAYKDFANSEDLKQFIAGQIPADVNVRFGMSESHHFWTELALPWLQAKNIIADAKNIQSTGTQATCENLQLRAEQALNLDAAKQESHSETHSAGVTAGVNCLTGAPSLALDYSTSENKALEYITSRFNVSGKTTLIAGGKLSLRGTLIETLKAVLEAESVVLETKQDESHGSHFSAHASTKGSAGFSAGKNDRKFAKEQTGIHAKETLIAKIKKEIQLLGAVIEVGTKAKPIQTKLPDGKAVAFYELDLPENGILALLKLSPEKILKQLNESNCPKLAEVLIALQKQFVLAVWDSSLPQALQTEQTRGWKRLLKDTAEGFAIVTKEIAEKVKNEALTEFLLHKLNALDIDILYIVAKLSGINIRLWSGKAEVATTASVKSEQVSPVTNNTSNANTNNPAVNSALGSNDTTTNTTPNSASQNQNQKQIGATPADAPKNQNPSLNILKTEGCGDCAFHAIFGKWDSKMQKVFCSTVPQKRKDLANAIQKLKSQSPIFPLVVAVIQEMLDTNKPLFGKLKTAYRQHVARNKQLSETAWRKLEIALKTNKITSEFIVNGSHNKDDLKNFKEQFQYCLRLDDGILRNGIILSLGHINTLYEEYDRQTKATFDLADHILKDKTILIEYAKYLQKMGQVLLPHEVSIIAFVFNKNIKFITYNRLLKKYTAPENLNPKGKDPVGVSFNGANHFERAEGDYILASSAVNEMIAGPAANAVNANSNSNTVAKPNSSVVNTNPNTNAVSTNPKVNTNPNATAQNTNPNACAAKDDKQSKDAVESKNLKETDDSINSKPPMDLNKSKDANESNTTKNITETQDIQVYKTITIDPKADTLNLKYSPKTKSWSILHSQPGLVMASAIYGSDVIDSETSTEIGMNASNNDVGNFFNSDAPKAPTNGGGAGPVSGMVEVDLRTKNKKRENRAIIAGPVTLTTNTISGVGHDISKAQVITKDKQHHYGAAAPTGNPLEIANDMARVATTMPKMFRDTEASSDTAKKKAEDTNEINEVSKKAKKTVDTSNTSTNSANSEISQNSAGTKGGAGTGAASTPKGIKQNTSSTRSMSNSAHGTSGSNGSKGSSGSSGSKFKGNTSGQKNKIKVKTPNTSNKKGYHLPENDDTQEILLYPSKDQLQSALLNSIKLTRGSESRGTGLSFIGTANAGIGPDRRSKKSLGMKTYQRDLPSISEEDLYPTKRMLNDLRHQQSMTPSDTHTAAKRKKETEYFIQKPFEFRPKNYLWRNPKPQSLFLSPQIQNKTRQAEDIMYGATRDIQKESGTAQWQKLMIASELNDMRFADGESRGRLFTTVAASSVIVDSVRFIVNGTTSLVKNMYNPEAVTQEFVYLKLQQGQQVVNYCLNLAQNPRETITNLGKTTYRVGANWATHFYNTQRDNFERGVNGDSLIERIRGSYAFGSEVTGVGSMLVGGYGIVTGLTRLTASRMKSLFNRGEFPVTRTNVKVTPYAEPGLNPELISRAESVIHEFDSPVMRSLMHAEGQATSLTPWTDFSGIHGRLVYSPDSLAGGSGFSQYRLHKLRNPACKNINQVSHSAVSIISDSTPAKPLSTGSGIIIIEDSFHLPASHVTFNSISNASKGAKTKGVLLAQLCDHRKYKPVPLSAASPNFRVNNAKTITSSYATNHLHFELYRKLTSKSLNELAKPVDQLLIDKMRRKGWTIHIAKKGTDEYRYLMNNNIDASFNTGVPKHILIKEGATKSALLEEYLHGTQTKLGLLEKYGSKEALEVHVKDFMLRHAKILGLDNPHDLNLLKQLKIEEIDRLNDLNRGY